MIHIYWVVWNIQPFHTVALIIKSFTLTSDTLELSLFWPVSTLTHWALWCCLKSLTLYRRQLCVKPEHEFRGCWTCQCGCVCILKNASYFAMWVIRYIVRLGKRRALLSIQSKFRMSQNKALGSYSNSYVSLSMCLCVTNPLPADHTSYILPHGEDLPASRPRIGICLPRMPVLTWHLMIWYG